MFRGNCEIFFLMIFGIILWLSWLQLELLLDHTESLTKASHTYFNLKYIFTTLRDKGSQWRVERGANRECWRRDENLVVLRFTIVRFVIIVWNFSSSLCCLYPFYDTRGRLVLYLYWKSHSSSSPLHGKVWLYFSLLSSCGPLRRYCGVIMCRVCVLCVSFYRENYIGIFGAIHWNELLKH